MSNEANKEKYRRHMEKWRGLRCFTDAIRSYGKRVGLSDEKLKEQERIVCEIEKLICPEAFDPKKHFGEDFYEWVMDVDKEFGIDWDEIFKRQRKGEGYGGKKNLVN
jgi:hypothetical protein